MVRLMLVLVLGVAGCKSGHAEGPSGGTEVKVEPPATPPAPSPAPAPAPSPSPVPPDPAALYAECRDRLELPEAANECKVDADCSATGCGKEVCTTAKGAADVMTTCEDKPCFKVVDACGCHAGACTWNVKATMPALPAPLPRSLPSGGPPAQPAPAPAP